MTEDKMEIEVTSTTTDPKKTDDGALPTPISSKTGKRERESGTNEYKNKRNRNYAKEGSSEIVKLFSVYAKEYDDYNDRYERIVKNSRDITIESKRLIFLLHRIFSTGKEETLKQADIALQKIHAIITRITVELEGQDPHKYKRSFTNGMQEYIEAISLYYFIDKRSLITKEQVEQAMQKAHPKAVYFPVLLSDYILGVADLTGELMRMAINSITGGDRELPFSICGIVAQISQSFDSLPYKHFDLEKKIPVLKQSLGKIENVCYQLKMQKYEFPALDFTTLLLADEPEQTARYDKSEDNNPSDD